MSDEQRRALAVAAHPDDIDFGASGTIALWVEQGWDVHYVVVTSGQRGVQDVDQDIHEFGQLREAEQRAAAQVLGVTEVRFLGYIDNDVVLDHRLRKDIAREFRRHRPHRLFAMTPDLLPTDFFVNHPDHRAVGTATLDITMTGGTTAAIYPELIRDEGLQPWRELEETWLMGPGGGSTVVDITSTVDRRFEALRAHKSQTGDSDVEAFIRPRLAEIGRPHGYAYAESFRVISYRR
ncbi:MAG TPA: PIG-L deacetylase family protein [Mycobacteriales bacterium]|nr:PIG-L deacetylase family protein [Mycobacteriales bacterium]